MSAAAVSRVYHPSICVDPKCKNAPLHDGLFCGLCLERMAQDFAFEVRHVRAYVPAVPFLRGHYGYEELTLEQAVRLHERILTICSNEEHIAAQDWSADPGYGLLRAAFFAMFLTACLVLAVVVLRAVAQ